jgi:hypothetical protein
MTASSPADSLSRGRRALLTGGLGAAALLAAPADACMLVSSGKMPDYMLTDRQARVYINALLREANKGERAVREDLDRLPRFTIVAGGETLQYFETARMLVSHGRRDQAPASIDGMVRLARGGYTILYLLALRRTLYFPPPPDHESDCARSPDEGFHTRTQMWLFRYHPDSPILIRQPELDRDQFALFPGPARRRA